MSYKPVVPPEKSTVCPILLTQPEKDFWAPLHLAELFLKRIKKGRCQDLDVGECEASSVGATWSFADA